MKRYMTLGTIFNSVSYLYSNEFKENEFKERLVDYILDLRPFCEKYDYEDVISEFWNIISGNKFSFKCEILGLSKCDECTNRKENEIIDAFDKSVLKYFNTDLYRAFVKAIKLNWPEGKATKIRIRHDIVSKLYSSEEIQLLEIKLMLFTCDLGKWLGINHVGGFIKDVIFEENGIYITLKPSK